MWVWVALAAVLAGMFVLGEGQRADAIGEGVFSLDKASYTIPEGQAVTVGVNRASGGILSQDIVVTLVLSGGTPGLDYPNATITQLATFKAGTNLTSQTVQFQTNNNNRSVDTQVQVSIQSVSGGGGLGAPAAAPLTIQGRGSPHVTGVTPRSGGPGTLVTITGDNFAAAGLTCSGAPAPNANIPAGPAAAPVLRCAWSIDWYDISNPISPVYHTTPTVLGPTLVQTTVPAVGLSLSVYDVRVTIADPSITAAPFSSISPISEADRFTFTGTNPTITNISPPAGPVAGGTVVTVTGTGFQSAPNVPACPSSMFFGGAQATGTCNAISTTMFTIVTPAGVTGPVDVVATFPGGTTVVTPQTKYTYTGAPAVTSISPNSGPAAGGSVVTIIGTGFLGVGCPVWSPPNPMPVVNVGVRFGAVPALSCNVVSDTQMVVLSPPNTGVQQVTVTNNNTGSSPFTTAANFTYVTGPVVTALDPSFGPPQGGSVVKITGSGFAPGATVTFGGTPGTAVTFFSSSSLQVTSPAGTGTVDVVVSVSGVSSPKTANDLFTYSQPVISSVVPNAGPTAGGTVVVINGANFTVGALVQFGAQTVPSVFVSPIQIQATSPAVGAPAVLDLRVVTPNGTSAVTPDDTFTYTNGPILAGINPGTGPTTGGIPVVITGTNFVAGATVAFGAKLSDAVNVNSATQITALLPAAAAPGVIDVKVTTSGGVSPVSTLSKFTYNATIPVIATIAPNKGPTIGGQSVQISGTGFLGVACPTGVKFGTAVATSCTVNSDTSITAISPPNVPGQTFLTVTSSSGTSEIALNYTYATTVPGGDPGNGSGNGGSGSIPGGQLPPPTGTPVTYQLSFRWTLMVWRGADGLPVATALRSPMDVTAQVSAVYGWNPATSQWLAYFPGSDAPGASNLATMSRGGVYWIAIVGPGPVVWNSTDG